MGNNARFLNHNVERAAIADTGVEVSRIALGTWAIGGWMWGGTDDMQSIWTIHAALDRGITLIDTAPVYGFGHSEEIVGKALSAPGQRSRAVIATKAGLQWENGGRSRTGYRHASPARVFRKVDQSPPPPAAGYLHLYQVRLAQAPEPLQ